MHKQAYGGRTQTPGSARTRNVDQDFQRASYAQAEAQGRKERFLSGFLMLWQEQQATPPHFFVSSRLRVSTEGFCHQGAERLGP